MLSADGCSGRKESVTSNTAASSTIAPAAAQPEANGNEAMTQTVEVTEGRSEDEAATATNGPKPTPASRTAAPKAAAPKKSATGAKKP
jgi:hypothetical protein